MTPSRRITDRVILGAAGVVLALGPQPSPAYITNTPVSFGQLCSIPPHISEARIEKVDQEKGIIIWRKIRDLKGKYPLEVIKHSIGKSHCNPAMAKTIARTTIVRIIKAIHLRHALTWTSLLKAYQNTQPNAGSSSSR